MARLHRLLRDAWAMAVPYWRSEDRWAARALLLVVVMLSLRIVYLNVLVSQWNNAFYNALQDKNYAVFLHQLVRFSWLAVLYIIVAVYQLYLNQMLQIRWRRWLTDRYLQGWLAGGAYYRMQVAAAKTDNPDQRIAEDLNLFVSGTFGLAIGGLRAAVTLVSFVVILWGLSGTVVIPLGRASFAVPGYMVWTALVYAIVGTWVTSRIGRPLVQLNFEQQRYEADFRFGLVRFREDDAARLALEKLDLELPDGRQLIGGVNLSLARGDTVLLGGRSGTGKSTLIRAVAGIWPFGRGAVRLPRGARILVLPQKPYLPIGTLRDVVGFPGEADDATLREALAAVELPELAGRLDEADHWALRLSPGEQQRIAFARALVQKPDWLFLDEATSALDEATEARLYRLLRDRLPEVALFSVGHRGTLRPFHARELVVRSEGKGPARIVDVSAGGAQQVG